MQDSKIEWTDHTFNPWWGCMKVSEGCKNCYAETLDNRYHKADPHWGPNSNRKLQSAAYWQQPHKWNAEAQKAGVKAKVFCASMADVFENHPDTLMQFYMLIKTIQDTPWLTWLLLTKRPENIMDMVPLDWHKGFPSNVWIGTSVENQAAANKRIPHLLKVPTAVRFLSMEPLLGPVDITNKGLNNAYSSPTKFEMGHGIEWTDPGDNYIGINWVIVGGESGPKARPTHPDWIRSLRDQCLSGNIPFFFKQWGEWYTKWIDSRTDEPVFKMWTDYPHFTNKLWANKGDACIDKEGKLCEIGGDFMTANYPVAIMQKVGKSKAGRLLDGIEYSQFPV